MTRTGLAHSAHARRTLAALAVAGTALAGSPGGAVTVDTGFYPRCPQPAGATYTCRDLFLTGFDGTRLDASLYVPNQIPEGGTPAVLMTHGYSGWHRGGWDLEHQAMLARAGYVVLGYTSRGFGRSDGTVQLDSPGFEVQDARTLISWLAEPHPELGLAAGAVRLDGARDPRIGMFGGSYAGGIQLLTASYDPRLDAITPQVTWNDLRYSLTPNGVIKHGWIDLLYPAGKYGGTLGPPVTFPPPVVSTDGVPLDQDVQVVTSYLANDAVDLPVAYGDGSGCTNSYCYLEYRSPVWQGVIDNVRAATLLIQGQRDSLFWMNEAVANARAIADNGPNGVPTKILVFSAGHGYPDLADERDAINARALAWLARHLKGEPTDTGPAVEVWRPWVAGTNFLGLAALPAATTDAGLSPTSATLLNAVAPTSHSEVTNFQPQTESPAFDAAPGITAADFTAAVGEGTTIAGIPVLRFRISATAPEAIVFAKLWDVDGVTGARALIHRLVTPARIRAGHGDFCASALPGPASAGLVSGVDVCLPLAGIVWKVESGHGLVLTIATSDSTHFGSRLPAAYTLSNVSLSLPTV